MNLHTLLALISAAALCTQTSAQQPRSAPPTAPVAACPDKEPSEPLDTRSPQALARVVKAEPPLARAMVLGQAAQFQRLLAQGANPNICLFSSSLLSYAVLIGDLKQAQLLLDAGALIDQPRSAYGSTPLLDTLSSARYEAAAFLLQRGANASASTPRGSTALHALALGLAGKLTPEQTQAQLRLTQHFISNGVPVNAQDAQGYTALMLASSFNQPELAALLLHHGADSAARDQRGETALAMAQRKGHTALRRLLTQAPLDRLLKTGQTKEFIAALSGCTAPDQKAIATDLLFSAVLHDNVEATQKLARCGADVNRSVRVQRDGIATHWTPLAFAATELRSLPLVQVLAQAGADLNKPLAVEPQGQGITPLHAVLSVAHISAATHTTDVVRIAAYLIEHGADLSVPSPPMGNTPLMETLSASDAALRPTLLRLAQQMHTKGARIDARNRHRMTALHLAAIAGDAIAVQWLLDNQADPQARDDQDKTALDYAHQTHATAVVAALTRAKR